MTSLEIVFRPFSDMLRSPAPGRSGPSGNEDSFQAEEWETAMIPCDHFVNYNSECEGFAADQDRMAAAQKINIEETMAVLTRCSFDESHRQPIFNLGGIPALAELIQVV